FDDLFRGVRYEPGDVAVDVDCGTGRWTRELSRRGLRACGFDVAPTMVSRAQELAPRILFTVASAACLPVASASQQVATSVTVLHHLPPEEQSAAVAELARVLRPGGWCLAVVLLDSLPSGRWCYPRNQSVWLELFRDHGLRAVRWRREEFLTPAILLQWFARGLAATLGRSHARGERPGVVARYGGKLYQGLHRLSVGASYPLEAAAATWFPNAPSTGLAALFVKEP
ncbi:MAG: class I SAM-dependent methyltransferase, partial [Candidatus Methylomirabilales bacterium]